ncbi:hypothetical protein J3F83DRAFT_87027 [Trichoderma novae-zelandiae]
MPSPGQARDTHAHTSTSLMLCCTKKDIHIVPILLLLLSCFCFCFALLCSILHFLYSCLSAPALASQRESESESESARARARGTRSYSQPCGSTPLPLVLQQRPLHPSITALPKGRQRNKRRLHCPDVRWPCLCSVNPSATVCCVLRLCLEKVQVHGHRHRLCRQPAPAVPPRAARAAHCQDVFLKEEKARPSLDHRSRRPGLAIARHRHPLVRARRRRRPLLFRHAHSLRA